MRVPLRVRSCGVSGSVVGSLWRMPSSRVLLEVAGIVSVQPPAEGADVQ